MYTLRILATLLFFHQLTAQNGKWYPWKQNEYFYGDDKVHWDFAKVLCERDLKAKLVVIETKEESSFLRNLYQDDRDWRDTNCWIGLRQGPLRCGCEDLVPNITCKQCRESWRWYDGTPMVYMEWDDGEPDNSMCGRLTESGWAEYLCDFRLRYLCERHLCVSFTCIHGNCKASNGTANCQCHPGYTGVHCDSEINECLEEPCLNNGICEDRVNDYWCNCTDSYQGKNCEHKKEEEVSEFLPNVKRQDLVIGLCVEAIVAAICLVTLAVLIIQEIKNRHNEGIESTKTSNSPISQTETRDHLHLIETRKQKHVPENTLSESNDAVAVM